MVLCFILFQTIKKEGVQLNAHPPRFLPTGLLLHRLLCLEEDCTTVRKADCTTLSRLWRTTSLVVAAVKRGTSSLCRIALQERIETSEILRLGLEIHVAVHSKLTFHKLTFLLRRDTPCVPHLFDTLQVYHAVGLCQREEIFDLIFHSLRFVLVFILVIQILV